MTSLLERVLPSQVGKSQPGNPMNHIEDTADCSGSSCEKMVAVAAEICLVRDILSPRERFEQRALRDVLGVFQVIWWQHNLRDLSVLRRFHDF